MKTAHDANPRLWDLAFAPPVTASVRERLVTKKRNSRSQSGPAISQPGGPDGIGVTVRTV